MKRLSIFLAVAALIILAGGALLATQAQAESFFASTDRVSYTGTLTQYATLSDAQGGINPIGGPYTIPNRVTDSPYNTAYRDVGIFAHKNYLVPDYGFNETIFLTAWYYTTNPDHGQYSGWGNPNNTNTGFIQLYDETSGTVTSTSAAFGGYNGTYYTTFNLKASGQNATYENAWARLWPAPLDGGAGALSRGTFVSYDLDVTFGGLQGVSTPGMIQATNHPTSVSGGFDAIFQNTNTIDPQYNGFYVVDFSFGMDNWAFGQTNLNGDFSPSEFVVTPLPGSVLLLGSGLLGLAVLGRRKLIKRS